MRVYLERFQLLIAFLIAGVIAFAGCAVIAAAPAFIAEQPLLDVWLRVYLFLFTVALVALASLPIRVRLKLDLAVGLLSVFSTLAVFHTLKNTPYAIPGVNVDGTFITAAITKFATFSTYTDFTYKDLPSFYPPLYFYLLGKAAALLSIEPYRMVKYGLIATVFLIPFITRMLWARLGSLTLAALMPFVFLVYPVNWEKPAEWLSLVLFLPWWLIFVEGVTSQRIRSRLGWLLTGGIIGGIIFQTYYYWFFIGGVSLLTAYLLVRLAPCHAASLDRTHLWNKLLMLSSAALFSAIYWLPLLSSIARAGSIESFQNRLMFQELVPMQIPFMNLTANGAFALGGLVYLAFAFQRDRLAFVLFNLLIAAYLWVGLGYMGIVTDFPLLNFKTYELINYILPVAAVLGLVYLRRDYPAIGRQGQTVVATLAVGVLLFTGQSFVQDFAHHPGLKLTFETKYPDRLIADFKSTTGNTFTGTTLLSDTPLPYYLPVYSFLAWDAHYSHPAAHFSQRATFLKQLSSVHDPTLFAAALMNNRYDRIDTIVFDRSKAKDTLSFSYIKNNFPWGYTTETISYAESLFDPRYFSIHDDGGYLFLTPRYDNNPLAGKAAQTEAAVLEYSTIKTFGTHLALANQARRLQQASSQLDGRQFPWQNISPDLMLDLLAADPQWMESLRPVLLSKMSGRVNTVLANSDGKPVLRVLGYVAQPLLGTHSLKLDLYFETLATPTLDYTIWMHGAHAEATANYDHKPSIPTSGWLPGRVYRDSTTLGGTPGEYTIAFGLWHPDSGARLANLATKSHTITLEPQVIP